MISVHQLIPMDNPHRDPKIYDPRRLTVQNLLAGHPDLTKLYHRMLRPGTSIRPYRVSGYCNKWLTRVYSERLTFLRSIDRETMRSIDIEVYEAEIAKTKSMLRFLIGYKRTIQYRYRKEQRTHRSW